jgi:hypothetical protein
MDGPGIAEVIKKLIEMVDHLFFTPELKITTGTGKRKGKGA